MAKKNYTELTNAASLALTDIFPVITDVSTTPATKKASLQVLADLFASEGLTGQSLYECVVDAGGGGDYTTLGAAITAGKTRIFIKAGSYTESAITTTTAAINIVGESRDGVVLNFGENSCTFSGANVNISNVTFTFSTGGLVLSGATQRLSGSYINRTGNSSTATLTVRGTNAQIIGNKFNDVNTTASHRFVFDTGTNQLILGNIWVNAPCINGYAAIFIDSESFSFTGNQVNLAVDFTEGSFGIKTDATGIINSNIIIANGNNAAHLYCYNGYVLISGNYFYSSAGNGGIGIEISGGSIVGNFSQTFARLFAIIKNGVNFSGNNIIGSRSTSSFIGVYVGGDFCCVSGNIFDSIYTGVKIESTSYTYNSVVGNVFKENTVPIVNVSYKNTITGNTGDGPISETKIQFVKNASGGAIAEGDIVILKATAAGDEVTTTTTGGDDKVFGVAVDGADDGNYFYVQTLGKLAVLKVNGVDNIAVGDFISTYTSAGIGKKAAAGDTAIAIALEAYETDDSSGVIDALIIPPRKIGAVV